MVIVITITPWATQGARLEAMERVKHQINVGALSGEFSFDHSYITTGHSESDHYTCQWSIGSKA